VMPVPFAPPFARVPVRSVPGSHGWDSSMGILDQRQGAKYTAKVPALQRTVLFPRQGVPEEIHEIELVDKGVSFGAPGGSGRLGRAMEARRKRPWRGRRRPEEFRCGDFDVMDRCSRVRAVLAEKCQQEVGAA
jgi:hypothetical protein